MLRKLFVFTDTKVIILKGKAILFECPSFLGTNLMQTCQKQIPYLNNVSDRSNQSKICSMHFAVHMGRLASAVSDFHTVALGVVSLNMLFVWLF